MPYNVHKRFKFLPASDNSAFTDESFYAHEIGINFATCLFSRNEYVLKPVTIAHSPND